jgi:hypothetical protein
MQLDRDDIYPLTIILLFGLGIPLGLSLGFGSGQQVIHQFGDIAKDLAIVSVCLAVLIAFFHVRSRRREWRLINERGEQACSDFAAQFTSESEQRAATLIFDRIRQMTATKRLPKLGRGDQLTGPPLFLVTDDLTEQVEELCEELDICTALNFAEEVALYNATTVEQLVLALAHFIEEQGLQPAVTSADSG